MPTDKKGNEPMPQALKKSLPPATFARSPKPVTTRPAKPAARKTVTAEDKTPPAVPVGLEVKASEAGAYVTWEPNSESDLAGYRVFRSEWPDTGFKSVTDRLTGGVGFFDSSYRPGLYYAVAAVDESGNESPMSPPFRGP